MNFLASPLRQCSTRFLLRCSCTRSDRLVYPDSDLTGQCRSRIPSILDASVWSRPWREARPKCLSRCPEAERRRSRWINEISVTRLGKFWKFLATNLLAKVVQKHCRLLKKVNYCKICRQLLVIVVWQLLETFGQLLNPQHLVTLIML